LAGYTLPIPTIQRVMEYYENHEEDALTVDTTERTYKFTKGTPKQVILYARGVDVQVNFDESVTTDSFYIPSGGSISIALQVKTIYAKTPTGTGTLYILGLW